MLSCREVSRLTATDELVGAGLRLRLAVRLHRLLCRACRRYASQIRSLGTWARRCSETGPEDAESLVKLRSSILRQSHDGDGNDPASSMPEG